MGGRWGNKTTRRRRRRGERDGEHHPPLAPRATARGVDSGWNDDAGGGTGEEMAKGGTNRAGTGTTPRHRHEHLLVGWIVEVW
jgi:hypothetical protein